MPFVIGVAGSSGSGKTTTSAQLAKYFGKRCIVVSADNYYKGRNEMTVDSFDHPAALDFPLLAEQVQQLKLGESIEMPGYDFSTSNRTTDTTHVKSCDIIIVEGILTLHDEALRGLLDVSIFVDTDVDVCRERRLARDVKERGRTYEHALAQWNNQVLPAYTEFVLPSRDHATILIANTSHSDTLEFDIRPVIADLEALQNNENAIRGRRTYSLFPIVQATIVPDETTADLTPEFA